jgi:hypothetical protein
MSKGKKILILFILMVLSSSMATKGKESGDPQGLAFFSFATAGLLVAIIVVAISRRESRDR